MPKKTPITFIQDIIELSLRKGRLSVMHASVAPKIQTRLELFLSNTQGQSRHIRLKDRDVWLAFEPTVFKVKADRAHALSTSVEGSYHLYVCTDQGTTFSKLINKQDYSDHLSKDDNALVQWMLRQADNEQIRIALQEKLPNRLDRKYEAPRQTSHQHTSRMTTWHSSTTDHLQSDLTPSNHTDISSKSGDIGNHLSEEPSYDHWEQRLSVAKLFETNTMYLSLMGIDLIATPDAHDLIVGFREALKADVLLGRKDALLASRQKQHARLDAAGVTIDLSSEAMQQVYTVPVLNFIADAPTLPAVRYRAQFVEQSLSLFIGQEISLDEAHALMNLDDLGVRFGQLLATKENELLTDSRILSAIDAGRYPSAEIAEKWQVPHMSTKQFRRAMELFGGVSSIQANRNGSHIPLYKLSDAGRQAHKAAALAKLPEEWFQWGAQKWDVLTTAGTLDLSRNTARYSLEKTDFVLGTILPYLENTGRQYDVLKGQQLAAIANGADASDVKQKIRELGLQWRWMTSGPGSLENRLADFESKYKIKASFKDYAPILNGLLQSVLYRCAIDHPHLSKDVFVFFRNHGEIQFDESVLGGELLDVLADGMDEYDIEYDEDTGEEISVPAPSVDEVYGTLSLPYVESVRSDIQRHETDARVPARLNDELHKVYSRFLRDANEGSATNLQWTPLLDAPLAFDGFELHSISERLELLSEGTEMNHCVFSYLSQCLQGQSVILSAREPETGNRIATIELKPTLTSTDDGEELVTFELQQCFGYANTKSKHIESIQAQLEEWLVRVNRGEVPTNGVEIIKSEDTMEDVYDQVENDPAHNGVLLQHVPYTEDGVFLAYYLFNRYTPAHMSVVQTIEKNEVLMELYYGSEFPKHIAKIEAIAAQLSVTPEQVVQLKMKHRLPDWDATEQLLRQYQQVKQSVGNVMDTYGPSLTQEQCFQQLKAVLLRDQLQFQPTYTSEQFFKDVRHGDGWLASVQPVPRDDGPIVEHTPPTHTQIGLRR